MESRNRVYLREDFATLAQRFESGSILGLFPGDVLEGRFQVGQLIGYGGQGVVLSVNHLEWARSLALKLPLPEAVDSPKKTERFIREAEAWIRLGVHPNIVRCWFVRRVSGLPGLFLDLITGGSVEDKIKSRQIGAPNWERILQVITEVAEGLSHAHGLGMIHRDIKPSNVQVSEIDGQLIPKVIDFGLAQALDPDSARTGRLRTQTARGRAPGIRGRYPRGKKADSARLWAGGRPGRNSHQPGGRTAADGGRCNRGELASLRLEPGEYRRGRDLVELLPRVDGYF